MIGIVPLNSVLFNRRLNRLSFIYSPVIPAKAGIQKKLRRSLDSGSPLRCGRNDVINRRVNTWILHESEAFICKALKGEAIVAYAEPLITRQMKASGSPAG